MSSGRLWGHVSGRGEALGVCFWAPGSLGRLREAVSGLPEALGDGFWTLGDSGSLFLGSASGIPYKIYAVQAPAQGISFTTFALMSFPARLYRLLIASLLAAGIGHLTRHWSNRLRYSIFAAFWIVSYAIYFYNFIG